MKFFVFSRFLKGLGWCILQSRIAGMVSGAEQPSSANKCWRCWSNVGDDGDAGAMSEMSDVGDTMKMLERG